MPVINFTTPLGPVHSGQLNKVSYKHIKAQKILVRKQITVACPEAVFVLSSLHKRRNEITPPCDLFCYLPFSRPRGNLVIYTGTGALTSEQLIAFIHHAS